MLKKGFTLAETLITLGVIGIVAAITMPVVIQKYKEKSTVAQVKKLYSMLSQAFTLAVEEKGTPDNWGLKSAHNDSISPMIPYLHIYKQCMDRNTGCFPVVKIKSLDGSGNWNYHNFYNTLTGGVILNNGTFLVTYYTHSPECERFIADTPMLKNVCGTIAADINGEKGPNQIGHDIFWFYLTKKGIYPIGAKDDVGTTIEKKCNINNKDGENGIACSAWIIFNENMDYLHKEIEW